MFQKMAATIDLKSSGVLPDRYEGPTPSLKDQIVSGSILREMYDRKEIQIEDSWEENQKKFLSNFSKKQ